MYMQLIITITKTSFSQLIISSGIPDNSNSLFSATVISANNDAKTISSQLMFTASETLDEMKVTCTNNENPSSKDTCGYCGNVHVSIYSVLPTLVGTGRE